MSEIRYSAHWLACQPPEYQRAVVKSLTPEQLQRWQSSWIQWIARDEQIPPPGDWRTWLYLAGRGAGKTRSGAEWIHEQVGAGRRRIALVAPTAADVRDVTGYRERDGGCRRGCRARSHYARRGCQVVSTYLRTIEVSEFDRRLQLLEDRQNGESG